MKLQKAISAMHLRDAQARLKKLEEEQENLLSRREALEAEEAELAEAVEEVTVDTGPEEKEAAEKLAEELKQKDETLKKEEAENAEKRQELKSKIESLQAELEEMNSRVTAAKMQQAEKTGFPMERKDVEMKMETRKLFGMSYQERDTFFERDEVSNWVEHVRKMGKERRSITGADLAIPQQVLGLIRENIPGYSKLYKHVNVRPVPGEGKMIVAGAIPEAVWTEMCGKINEMNLSFSMVQVSGHKVAGFVAVCNSLLEDTTIALGTEIIMNLTQSIGLALDKAILYGTGTNMPLGIVPRLVQTQAPTGQPAGTRAWADLHTSNVTSISGSKTDLALYKAIITAIGAAKGKYSAGQKFWAMNEKTKAALVTNAMSINAAGAIVTGQNGAMPVVGGAIEELSFMPDNVIVGGYGDMYLLAERAGTAVAMSEDYKFAEDQTVYRAKARYDGLPAIPEAFVAIDIAGGTISGTAVTFAADTANAASD